MLPDRVSNPGPLTYESGALPIALRGPAPVYESYLLCMKVISGDDFHISTMLIVRSYSQLNCLYICMYVSNYE